MADFAASRSSQKRNFAHREGREVIVQHEALFGFSFEAFQPLHVVARAEGCRHQRLRLAAGKDRATVRSRQNSSFDPDLANLVEGPAVRTMLLVDDLIAEDALAQSFVILFEL